MSDVRLKLKAGFSCLVNIPKWYLCRIAQYLEESICNEVCVFFLKEGRGGSELESEFRKILGWVAK